MRFNLLKSLYTFIFLFCIEEIGFSQNFFSDSSKKTHYLAVTNLPTLRNFFYAVGIERYRQVNKKFSYTSSISMALCPFIPDFQAYNFSACLQPVHLIAGMGRLKFESGLSISYFNENFNNAQSVGGFHPFLLYNAYFGGRYFCRRKPIHIRFGYVPFYSTAGGFSPFGIEFGLAWVLGESKYSLMRKKMVLEYRTGS